MRSKFLSLIAVLAITLMTGCASTSNKDPLEGLNRGIYKFNDVTDKAIFKPIAGAYKAVAPTPVQTGINNFFGNLRTFMTTINQVLQFKFNKAAESATRFVVNSTVGIAGFIDVASKTGLPQYKEDFGQTLGYWGIGNGPYLMLPVFGPSSIRDAGGLFVDGSYLDPIAYVDNVPVRNTLYGSLFISTRASYLPGSDLLDEAALDPYTFMRDAYLQRRENQVADGVTTKSVNDFEGEDPAATQQK
jgi:phospholipid-binding lipoprotein MlaA